MSTTRPSGARAAGSPAGGEAGSPKPRLDLAGRGPGKHAGAPRAGGEAGSPKPRLVPAVERAVGVLDALAEARRPQSLADLARALSLPRSSVHGLLATLVALGLARRNDDAEFSIGPKALRWADAYGSGPDLRRAFDARVDDLPALHTETVMLAALDGADVVYLACRPGSRPLAVNFRVGGRFPAECTSSGKAMLSALPDDAVRERLQHTGLRRLTRHSPSSVAALLRQLASVRRIGHAIDDEETAEGMQCFGAPVRSARSDRPTAAVAVSVIKAGLGPRRRAELAEAIRTLAERLSAELGATPPSGSGPSTPLRPTRPASAS
jgi:DNA-binding IclR family transcriptional regulator